MSFVSLLNCVRNNSDDWTRTVLLAWNFFSVDSNMSEVYLGFFRTVVLAICLIFSLQTIIRMMTIVFIWYIEWLFRTICWNTLPDGKVEAPIIWHDKFDYFLIHSSEMSRSKSKSIHSPLSRREKDAKVPNLVVAERV